MDFIQLAKKRYSVRKYENRPVEDEKLQLILEAGRVAPTGANRQPQHLIVCRTTEGLTKLRNSVNFFGAPLAIVICVDRDKAWVRPMDKKNITDIDASIVCDHMMLEATDLGLGTCWICYFKADAMQKDFNLPENMVPVNVLAIGYPAEPAASPDRHSTERNPVESMVRYE